MIHLVHRSAIALVCAAILGATASGADAQTPLKFTLDWRFEGPAAPFTMALIGLTFDFKSKPKVEDIFTDACLPPPADRKVD